MGDFWRLRVAALLRSGDAPREAHNVVAIERSWQPASRRELWLLGAYFALMVALTDVLNIRIGVELMTLALAAAAIAISRELRAFVRDWWFFLIGLVLWHVSGPIAAKSPFPLHLDLMLNLDNAMFFGHSPVIETQHHLANPGHVQMLDWIAGASYNLHVPEPYIAGYFLWRLNRLVYLQFASAALILLVLGFITFVVFPAVPPWLAAQQYGRLDHVYNGFSVVLARHPMPFHGTWIFMAFHFAGDRVAAFPSEHAAFPVLEYLAFRRVSRTVSLVLLAWVVWVLFVVVYLGEHWVTDAVAGWAYALGIYAFVLLFTRPGRAARSA